MDFLTQAERKFKFITIPNLTLLLMVGQIFVFGMNLLNEKGLMMGFPMELLALKPGGVLQGEVWRMITFMFYPPLQSNPIFLLFAWGIFYLTGTNVEAAMGAFRYTLFILTYLVATNLAGFIVYFILGPLHSDYIFIGNWLLFMIVFLVFAYHNPEMVFRIYLVIPVKVKWLAWLDVGIMAFTFLGGGIIGRATVLAALCPIFLFYGKDLIHLAKRRKRRVAYQKEMKATEAEAFHTCNVCGATDLSHPDRQFFYAQGEGYCEACQDKMPD